MNCPQCQTANGPDAAFCGNCGGRLAPAGVSTGATGYPAASGTPLGYNPAGTSSAYGAPGAPGGYNSPGTPSGYNPPGATGGYSSPPPSYGPAGGPAANQYQPPQYPPGAQYQQAQYPQGQYGVGVSGPAPQHSPSTAVPSVSFDLNRLTTVDRIVAGATLITMISIWLPWYAVSFGGDAFGDAGGTASFSGTWGHGWLWLEFVVALVLLAYLGARAAWDRLPFSLPVAHAPLLIVATALQLLLILIAFVDVPYGGEGMGWSWAAFIGLIAALAAAGPVIYPAVKSYRDSRNAAGPRTY